MEQRKADYGSILNVLAERFTLEKVLEHIKEKILPIFNANPHASRHFKKELEDFVEKHKKE